MAGERNQAFAFCAQKLELATAQDIKVAISEKTTIENYLQSRLNPEERSALYSFIVEYLLVRSAHESGLINGQQREQFFQTKLASRQRAGKINPELLARLKLTPLQWKSQIDELYEKNWLTPKETPFVNDIFQAIMTKEQIESSKILAATQIGGPEQDSAPKSPAKDALADLSLFRDDAKPVKKKKVPGEIGPYEIQNLLGEGGMAAVYQARHKQLDRIVAIKVMKDISDDTALKRFISESRVNAKLKHPHIIGIYDAGEADGFNYITMDLVRGQTFDDFLTKKPPLRKSLQIMKLVLEAMEFAHDHKVVHRDLKPSNIMIENESERPIVMDFGLAKDSCQSSDLTKTGDIMGTPKYMAPEQARGQRRKISARTDVYSLGAILYEVLTGTAPVQGRTAMDMMYQLINSEIVPVRERNPRIPVPLESICMKALQKDPQKRYASAKEFRRDLDLFLKKKKVKTARRQSSLSRAWQKIKKHKFTIGIPVIILLVIINFAWIQSLKEKKSKSSQQVQQTIAQVIAEMDRFQTIMLNAREVVPSTSEMQSYLKEIGQMRSQKILERMVNYIKTGTASQRRVVIQALANYRDPDAVVNRRPIGEHLRESLATINIRQQEAEAILLIQALAKLKYTRARQTLIQLFNEHSLGLKFWDKVAQPASVIFQMGKSLPKYPRQWHKIALDESYSKNWDGMIFAATLALEKAPDRWPDYQLRAQAYYEKGLVQERQSKTRAAIGCYDKALANYRQIIKILKRPTSQAYFFAEKKVKQVEEKLRKLRK